METLQQFFVDVFGDNVWLAVVLFAVLPLTEARLAIPFGLSVKLWGSNVLHPVWACVCGVVGSFLPCVFIILFLKPILKWLMQTKWFKGLALKIESLANKKSTKIKAEQSEWKKYTLLGLFVAIPLPLTGVWSGSLIASMLNLSTLKSAITILCGNIVAGTIITVISVLFGGATEVLMLIILVIIVVYVLIMIVLNVIKKHKKINCVYKTNSLFENKSLKTSILKSKQQYQLEKTKTTIKIIK